jgi:hypothetical protein
MTWIIFYEQTGDSIESVNLHVLITVYPEIENCNQNEKWGLHLASLKNVVKFAKFVLLFCIICVMKSLPHFMYIQVISFSQGYW